MNGIITERSVRDSERETEGDMKLRERESELVKREIVREDKERQ